MSRSFYNLVALLVLLFLAAFGGYIGGSRSTLPEAQRLDALSQSVLRADCETLRQIHRDLALPDPDR